LKPHSARRLELEKGRVVFAERFSGYGRMVIIDHGERYFSVYAHLSEILRKLVMR
jgi:septal ring factor EnvC (AmiA/AmiB activator)